MRKYIAFLRGTNISGRNKIVMSDLKNGFEQLGFLDVSTYLNCGNVLFSSENENITEKLKSDNPILWVQKMNNIRNRAMEIVNSELIYTA